VDLCNIRNKKRRSENMSLKTNIDVIIHKMCSYKRNDDMVGFHKYIDSLKVDEWKDLEEFAISLRSLCESEIKRKPRIVSSDKQMFN
jgi:hypothetical protein